ncbi:MAG: HAD family hydrolase [Boseongicola sp.]
MITTLCFDADDTLWHNERFFRMTQDHFAELLADFVEKDHVAERLLAAEKRNLGHYGFGIKGFMLSMIETALDITENRVPGSVVRDIISAGQEMLAHPIELLPGVEDTILRLAPDFRILLITKGDLLDQERKIAQSGLGEMFDGVEIVSEKTPKVYLEVFARNSTAPEQALMAGNSLKSDVIPAIEAGGWAIHVPHSLTWEIEAAEAPSEHERFRKVREFRDIPDTVEDIQHKI